MGVVRCVGLAFSGYTSMIPVDARRKTMLAGSVIDTHSVREAAIVGGIVRCTIATGCYNPDFIRRYTHDILGEFHVVNVDRTPPNMAELAMVVDRFEDALGRPF